MEPSWSWAAVGRAVVDQVLRPRTRPSSSTTQNQLNKRLTALGHATNAAGDHVMALTFFEAAFSAKDDAAALLSAINMRLKLGQLTLAAAVYTRLLEEPNKWGLGAQETELARRKLEEANEAAERRAREPRRVRPLEDEIAQLLRDRRDSLPEASEADSLAKMLRTQGHAANEAADYEGAQTWFDACQALSRAPADLLSAANMRVKLFDSSPAAEALYVQLLSLPSGMLGEAERELATRKLAALRERRDAGREELAASSLGAWLDATALHGGSDDDDESEPGDAGEAQPPAPAAAAEPTPTSAENEWWGPRVAE